MTTGTDTGADTRAALQRLTARIEALQLERRELRRKIASTGELVQRHERMLDDLKRGLFAGRPRGRFLVWFSAALLLIAGFGGYVGFTIVTNRADTSMLGIERIAPVQPHLLVTSDPPGLKLFIDGKPGGVTGRLLPAPRSAGRVKVRVLTPGGVRTKTLTVTPRAGAHWHVGAEAR